MTDLSLSLRIGGGGSTGVSGGGCSAPTLSSLSAYCGPVDGGTEITITGTNFTGLDAVLLGGTPQTIDSSTDTEIVFTTDPGLSPADPGLVTLTIGTDCGLTNFTNIFEYVAAPTVDSTDVDSGSSAGGTTVTVTGTGFDTATSVTFDGVEAASFEADSDTEIVAVTAAGSVGTGDIVVTTCGGTDTLVGGWTYDNWNSAVAALTPWAWWKHDDDNNPPSTNTAADSSGNARTGTYNGDSTHPLRRQTGPTLVGVATPYCIVGQTQRAVRDAFALDTLTAGSFSLACFIKGSLATTGRLVNPVAGNGMFLTMNYNIPSASVVSGTISFLLSSTGADAHGMVWTGTGWNDNEWHLLVVNYNRAGASAELFLDATSLGSIANSAPSAPSPSNDHEWFGTTATPMNGVSMAQRIFLAREMTLAEQQKLMAYSIG